MEKYRLDLSEKQLMTVADALEFYSRFIAGQWEIPPVMQIQERDRKQYKSFWEKRNEVEDKLDRLSGELRNMPISSSYGIGSPELSEDAKISYDIYRPILEEFNKDADNVYSSPGLSFSEEGRIKVEKL